MESLGEKSILKLGVEGSEGWRKMFSDKMWLLGEQHKSAMLGTSVCSKERKTT